MRFIVITEWPLVGWESDFVQRLTLKEGISEQNVERYSVCAARPPNGELAKADHASLERGRALIREIKGGAEPYVILAFGEWLLRELTGREGIDKWHCSPLSQSGGSFIVPSLSVGRVTADMSQQVWLQIAAQKAARAYRGEIKEQKHVHYLNPPIDETLALLRDIRNSSDPVAVDIETGRGQINTVGFAWGPDRGLAINVLPSRASGANFRALWEGIASVIESDQPKLLQNFIYETSFFSRYGIALRGVKHDTMIAQRFLWPEFEMGLDAIGRMYTDMPYWKDDGKDWSNIRDWEKHYEYNCKDTTGTYQGYLGQCADLRSRNLDALYDGYVRRLFPLAAEMCARGLPVSPQALTKLKTEIDQEYADVLGKLRSLDGASALNPRSPAQIKKFLTSEPRKYTLYKKRNAVTKTWQDSTDEKSLKKLRIKHPDDPAIDYLLRVAKLGKTISSYLNATYDPDARMRFSLVAGGTETMRWTGYCDPWDNGVNPQTIPGGSKGVNVKSVFIAPEGKELLQIDLKQAESRFVAYDSADLNLIQALEDPKRDIHSEVAAEICRSLGHDPIEERKNAQNWKKRWRQLGKKSGHGANYSMQEETFMDSCLAEMDLVLAKREATQILEAYHTLFPGIRRWHGSLRRELTQNRKLKTPWGWERFFYGRMNDATYREAYAFRPQSTVPYVINQLALYLAELRTSGQLDFGFLLQCHDSLLLEVPEGRSPEITKAAEQYENWQPGFDLPGGRLVIPIDAQTGKNWGKLE